MNDAYTVRLVDRYTVRLVDRNEGVEYRDAQVTYGFNITQDGRTWTVLLPPCLNRTAEFHEMTESERQTILPRLEKYLSRIKWLGFFPCSYKVKFERIPEAWLAERMKTP